MLSSVIDNGGGAYASGGDYLSKGSVAQAHMPDNIGVVKGGGYSNRVGFYNPPYFTYQRALASNLQSGSGNFTVTLPPNSVGMDVFDITMNKDPVSRPLNVEPDKIAAATDKMLFNEGDWARIDSGNLAEMAIFDEEDYFTGPLANKGLLTMRYQDANNDGVLDGSNPPVMVDTLNTWMLDEVLDSWVQAPSAGVDRDLKTLTVYLAGTGVYAMFGALDQAVANVKAYPVPFRPNGPRAGTGAGQTGAEGSCDKCGIIFENIPQTGRIEIYTLDGRLVRTLAIPANLMVQKLTWDVKNSSGQKAASGVYIWRLVSGSNAKTGKLMVIW